MKKADFKVIYCMIIHTHTHRVYRESIVYYIYIYVLYIKHCQRALIIVTEDRLVVARSLNEEVLRGNMSQFLCGEEIFLL